MTQNRPHLRGRRTFLRQLALGGGAAALGPALLQACGRGPGGGAESGGAAGGELVISNFPLYIDADAPGAPGSVARFQKDTGLRVRYVEDVNDVRQFFARIQPQLAAGRPLAQDLVVLTGWMAERLIRLGWVEPLPLAEVPNARNLVPSLRNPPWDPQQRYSLPWQSGIAGIAYNIKATGKELRGVEDLFDPALRGRVSALLEMRDTMGLLMLADGKDITRPTWPPPSPHSIGWSRPARTARSAVSPATTTRMICWPETWPPASAGRGMWRSWRWRSPTCASWSPTAAACSGPT